VFYTKMIIKGKKVYLRQLKSEDFEEFTALTGASRKFHHGFVTPPLDKENFDKYLEVSLLEANRYLLICQNADDSIVGVANLSQIFRKSFQNAYLGYWLGAKYAGRGFMTEAIDLILQYAFKTLNLHRIEANVQPKNLASINVLKRSGFTKEGFSRRYLKIDGRWRDHERWAIIVEDWKDK
jgi:ribosomal-protein-alanine N-acetyltransferase